MTRLAKIPFESTINTPALIWDLDRLDKRMQSLKKFALETDCRLLYSMKACSVGTVLDVIKGHIAGFSCSSLYESRLARRMVGSRGSVHLTTPALNPGDMQNYGQYTDYLSLNSLDQFERFHPALKYQTNCGIRINPQLSQVSDLRFDPCRPNSKLGVSLDRFKLALAAEPALIESIGGIQMHTACGNKGFIALRKQVNKMVAELPRMFERIDWFNLGGGYNFDRIRNRDPFIQALAAIRTHNHIDLFIEPGTAAVRNSAFLVSTIVDIFESEEQTIAVLDTTLNHMQEVLVYGFKPHVIEANKDGTHIYTLAGATCLAGDLFGAYRFRRPLAIGDRITFGKVGAYTHGQSHWFNGVNLPAIYSLNSAGTLTLERAFTFDDFKQRCAIAD